MTALDVRVWAARPWERDLIERANGSLASDACVLVAYGDQLLGWGDDYGTFRPLSSIGRRVQQPAEDFLAAVIELAAITEGGDPPCTAD